MGSLAFPTSKMGALTLHPTTMVGFPTSTSVSLHFHPSHPHRMKVWCQKTEADQKVVKKLPPGPMKLPIIGNLHNLAGKLPHHALLELAKEYGPILHLQLGEVSTMVVSDGKMAKEVLKTHDLNFAQRPRLLATDIVLYDGKDIAFSPYGEYYKQMKKVGAEELLGPKRVQSYSSLREEEVQTLVESVRMSLGKPINFGDRICRFTNVIVFKAAFGEECKEQDTAIAVCVAATTLAGGFQIADVFPSLTFLHDINGFKGKVKEVAKEIDRMLSDIVEEHSRKLTSREINNDGTEREDLVDVLLKLQRSGRFQCEVTTDHIKAVIFDFFIAGTETSSNTIEWAMSELMRNPRVLKKAQAEVREAFKGKKTIRDADVKDLKYLELVIKETLRLHPPLPLLLPRENKQSCAIGGYQIPAKARMIVNAYAIGRDPKTWRDADKFIPERFLDAAVDFIGMDFEYIPFGGGRRICPGMNLGMANMQLPLAQLLYHFDWKLPDGVAPEDLDMTETFGATITRKNKLHVIPTRYQPLQGNQQREAIEFVN
ncbi:premnaspirodiene oxygenase [Ricinus communis]|uniref:premnaspirodiene oxygenase n=1 Tax=Ricinus communis TaxID=3988 RepID=UPI00201B2597|nr:premnaspirodiene oxygenase [Ricinus communis]